MHKYDLNATNPMTVSVNLIPPNLAATSAPRRESFVSRLCQRASRSSQGQGAAWRTASLLAILTLCGCAEPTTGVVTGTVAVDGTPAKEGSIAFFPTNGKSPTAGGEILDGNYSATVPLGSCKVEIRVPKKIGEKKLYNTPDSPVKPILAETLPPKFNDATELTLDVQPGENRQDYDLKTN